MGARGRGRGMTQAGTQVPEHTASSLSVSCRTSGMGTRLRGQGDRPPYSTKDVSRKELPSSIFSNTANTCLSFHEIV